MADQRIKSALEWADLIAHLHYGECQCENSGECVVCGLKDDVQREVRARDAAIVEAVHRAVCAACKYSEPGYACTKIRSSPELSALLETPK